MMRTNYSKRLREASPIADHWNASVSGAGAGDMDVSVDNFNLRQLQLSEPPPAKQCRYDRIEPATPNRAAFNHSNQLLQPQQRAEQLQHHDHRNRNHRIETYSLPFPNHLVSEPKADQNSRTSKRLNSPSTASSTRPTSLSPLSKRSRIAPIRILSAESNSSDISSNSRTIPIYGSSIPVSSAPTLSLSPLTLAHSPFGAGSHSVSYEQRADYLKMLHIQRMGRQHLQPTETSSNQNQQPLKQHSQAHHSFSSAQRQPRQFYHTSYLADES